MKFVISRCRPRSLIDYWDNDSGLLIPEKAKTVYFAAQANVDFMSYIQPGQFRSIESQIYNFSNGKRIKKSPGEEQLDASD